MTQKNSTGGKDNAYLNVSLRDDAVFPRSVSQCNREAKELLKSVPRLRLQLLELLFLRFVFGKRFIGFVLEFLCPCLKKERRV